ncbi:hypothetical protein [Austwickia sp. TVS 96-490-7B]|uniref:hypothetical protein n=1 Tax=Austwickia sp. TVS 96-490-7B TaxID=2830843 RepID=UPI00210695D5|nr:hypothetical protein [Austwickia sp. TVS 96-490-7B]
MCAITEEDFTAVIDEADAMRSFVVPRDVDQGKAFESPSVSKRPGTKNASAI